MGAVNCMQAFLPGLKAQGEEGHVVLNASGSGMIAVPGTGPYNVSKFGIVALAETLAGELAGTSIGVTVMCTSWVRTRIVDSARNRPQRYGARTEASPAATEQLAALVRSGLEPDKVAEKLMHAIKQNELYVFTHPELRNYIEERFQRILAAYPKA
jgi:short-subunit dehydrogenase